MTLEILQNEMIKAMKNKDKLRKDTISSLIGAIKKAAIDKGCRDNITEDLVNSSILKEKKTMQEMIDTCPGERAELLFEYNSKMRIIDEFAPKLIANEAEIDGAITLICLEHNIELLKKNRSAIMKVIMPTMKGAYDLSVVNKRIGKLLR